MWFTSDNASGAAPEVMTAVARANEGYARSYGADALMDRVRDLVREVFEAPEAAVYLVTTGTVANALSLSLLSPPWGSRTSARPIASATPMSSHATTSSRA